MPSPGTQAPVWLGLMSGTSLDGVDGVAVYWPQPDHLRSLAHVHRPFSARLRHELLALNASGGLDELHRCAMAGLAVADVYADVVAALAAQLPPGTTIKAIGAHGQTVRHQPGQGYTVQLLNAAKLAERTGVCVVADFRSRDVAAGGQGAPLVPAFHQAQFGADRQCRVVLNIGGMANLSILNVGQPGHALGFDCGPGNVLLDGWCERHIGAPFDANGQWAHSGQVHRGLLDRLLSHPFLALPPPKSTGREAFNLAWLDELQSDFKLAPQDVQATLVEMTASACADCVIRYASNSNEVLVCGGGAANSELMQRLDANLPNHAVHPTDTCGLPAQQVEAVAFAWLAQRALSNLPGNLPGVTGAKGPRVLGAIYPA